MARSRALGTMSEGAVKASPGRLVALGEIVGTHGVGGLLRLRTGNTPTVALAAGQTVFLAPPSRERGARTTALPQAQSDCSAALAPAGTPRAMVVVSARAHGRVVLLELEGIASLEEAAPLVRCRLSIPETDLPAPGPHEFYAYQIEGLEVFTVGGERLGRITSSFPTGSNEVLVVSDGEREYLIPCIADVVRRIEVANGRVVIEPMEGLLA